MNILPKLLYLFQNIPLPPPPNLFSKLRKSFFIFLWNNKRARLRLTLLYMPYDRGGLACPNPLWYYWATQLRTTMFYFANDNLPAWREMECQFLELPLPIYLYSTSLKKRIKKPTKPITRNMIRVWHEVRKYLGEPLSRSRSSPIWGNDDFTPGRADSGFNLWSDKGVQKIQDLYRLNDDKLMSFEELASKHNIPQKHFLLISASPESSEAKLKNWREDLQEDLSIDEWEGACKKAQSQTANTRLKLLQYNWLMRTYITPEMLNKFNGNIPDLCFQMWTIQGNVLPLCLGVYQDKNVLGGC
ncbi:uncharacterized protein LOC115003560 [Cottoperca gobio]|uniref:Uncharacterized protein LOC115003560 n=1 Tax=Cottoperca gobio TaxID=56716 RepID=A0A6J2P742_COTGO|nr:uncharacterized protein LOC115003560 [Cottoperca gobio]